MVWHNIPRTIWLEKENEVDDCVKYLRQNQEGLAVDTETTGVSKVKDYPLLFSLSDGKQRFAGEAQLMQCKSLKDLLESDTPKIGSYIANADMHWLANIGINLGGPIYDTIVMDWLYDENREGQHGLKDITWDYLGIKMRDFKQVFPMKKGDTAGDAIKRKMIEDPEDAKEYSGLDAYCNYLCFEYLKDALLNIAWLENSTLWEYYKQIEVPYTRLLYKMSRRGIQLDVGFLRQQELVGKKYIENIRDNFNRRVEPILGGPINLKSSQQLRELFLNKLNKMPPNKKTPKGEYSIDLEVLSNWSDEGDDMAEQVVQYKKYTKIFDTYIKGLQEEVDNKYKLHTNFNQAGTTTGRLSSNSPNLQNCGRGDMEILTRSGWCRFDELQDGVEVAQWKNGVISFIQPEQVIRQYYKGNMIRLKNQHISLDLTEDHNCLLIQRKTNKIINIAAKNYPEDYIQLNAGKGINETEFPISDLELQLLCAIQADAYYEKTGEAIVLSFKKNRKSDRLKNILDSLKIPYLYKYKKVRIDEMYHQFRLPKSKWTAKIRSFLPKKIWESWILQLSYRQMELLTDELMYWDGLYTRKNNYFSKNKQNVDLIQALYTLTDKRSHMRKYKEKYYALDITNRNYSMTTNINKELYYYEGMVYCVTVPSNYIVVRHEGQTMITGNCPRPGSDPFKIREAFVSSYGKLLYVADFSQLELVILAHKSGDQNMIEAIKAGRDLHLFAVSLVFGYNYDDLIQAKKKEKKEGRSSLTEEQKLYLDLRQAMKTAGYLIIYGGGAYKLARGLTLEFRKSDPDTTNKQCEFCDEVYDMDIVICPNCGPEQTEAEQKINLWGKLTDKWAIPGKLNVVPRTVSPQKAQYYIDSWFKAFPGVKQFINYQHQFVQRNYHVRTFLGRYRRLPEIGSSNNEDKAKAKRQAVNSIQADASDILKITQLVIENDPVLKELDCVQLLQIHDELVFEGPIDKREECLKRIKYLMENSFIEHVFKLSVPLTVEGSCATNWAEAK